MTDQGYPAVHDSVKTSWEISWIKAARGVVKAARGAVKAARGAVRPQLAWIVWRLLRGLEPLGRDAGARSQSRP